MVELVAGGDLPMTVSSARDFSARWWEAAPASKGVYTLMLSDGDRLLDRCGYSHIAERAPTFLSDGLMLANVGSTTKLDLSRRLNHHLWGDSRVSSLRRSIAVLWAPRWMRPVGQPGHPSFHFGHKGEAWITRFIQRHDHFGWWPSERPAREEFELIARHEPMLNIKGLERSSWAQHLLGLRRRWADAADV